MTIHATASDETNNETTMSDYAIKTIPYRDHDNTGRPCAVTFEPPIDIGRGRSPAEAARDLAARLRAAADSADRWAAEADAGPMEHTTTPPPKGRDWTDHPDYATARRNGMPASGRKA